MSGVIRTVGILIVIGMTALGAGWNPRGAVAQEKYPSRPIDFIVPWGTGGGADSMAREVGSLSQPFLGVALPVSNVPGASGNTGLAQILAGNADGYTIAVYIADTLATIPTGLARHKVDDFAWIARTEVADSFLFVKTEGPFKTIQELFRHAQERPGQLRVASTGFGSVDDVTVRYLEKKGYKMTTVPYPKPGERYAATLGGHAEVLYEQAGDIQQYLSAGQLRPLIIFARKRHPAFPDVPASAELGLDITLPQFRGIVAKRGTPADRVQTLAAGFKKAMDTPQWKKFSAQWYLREDSYMGPEKFGEWVRGEATTLEKFVSDFGLRK
ncbi:MAG TPA: tripartite tricarboxylate transporter substrate binding protein [Methylomirabilota bacterium]|nr:tripartite tricarboxylate transporter substrate binding protein [Methylomirabilota bacterium]